ncbi:S-adenosyl-L-methionine-dependent methyltransferase [Mycena capillaripes]|nr:S-adenosyl-L-methionine-dependent methyltransferase [Mycena capillaripes]
MVSDALLQMGYRWLDRGLVPDFVLRRVIRALLRQRLREIDQGSFEANHARKMKWIEDVRARVQIAELTEKANEQHYEVPTKFILTTLGPYAKYSSCLYPTGKETLAEAEVLMLESYCQKAQLKDGQDVLDLGCGWGSLSLFLAQKYPNSRITGLSNSTTQKVHIDATAKARGLTNLEIITADVNTHDFAGSKYFDRILSIEARFLILSLYLHRLTAIQMFEHMKNYQILMAKVASWLRPTVKGKTVESDEALVFIHIFCHRTMPYHFEEDDGWMAQNFFSGGTMPSHDTLLYFQSDLTLVRSWYLPGTHYSRSLEDWLKLQDMNAKEGLKELREDALANGRTEADAVAMFHRFRVFYMACSELFNMDKGQQWGVGHYLFKKPAV